MKEFEFIKDTILSFRRELPEGVLAIGDDCSAVPIDENNFEIVTTDCLVEDVHFDLKTISMRSLGYKSLVASLSDIAAMGGKPKWCHLVLALPATMSEQQSHDFISGFSELAASTGVHLIGGDLSRSPNSLFINVMVTGIVNKKNLKRRESFTVGDVLCTNGNLGDSLAGLKLLQGASQEHDENEQYVIQQHVHPAYHREKGIWLGEHSSVHGMMDCSDGLLSSLQQLNYFYKRGFEVDVDKLPTSAALRNVCQQFNWNLTELALQGGEEYCLIFSVDPSEVDILKNLYRAQFDEDIFAIGRVTDEGISFLKQGQPFTPTIKGFTHF